jgi:hypothetical protein
MLRRGARPAHAIKSQMAAECARADVRKERRVWHAHRQPRMREQPYRLVFLDETYVKHRDDAPARAQPHGPAAPHERSLWTLDDPIPSWPGCGVTS